MQSGTIDQPFASSCDGPGVLNRAAGLARGAWLARHPGFSLVDILMVIAVIGVIAGVAVPVSFSAVNGQRFNGDAQAVTNLVGVAKMRASAMFTRARVRANLDTRSFVLERWDKDLAQWVAEDTPTGLARNVSFGFGGLNQPPPNTQQAIGLSPACRTGITAASAAIADTACITFNSRGLPIDAAGAIVGGHALYVTDGSRVAATTVTATPRIRRWATPANAVQWREQQ